MKRLITSVQQFYYSKASFITLLLIGAFLRFKHYFDNRSLWLDESVAAISIAHRSYKEILSFDYIFGNVSRPPLLFSLIEKSFVTLFGNTEYALRAFPLLCSLIALFLFYIISRRYFSRGVALISLALFSLSGSLIYYAAEVKQYSTDLLIALILLGYALSIQNKQLKWIHIALIGFGGALAIWIANISLFVLAAYGLTFGLFYALRKQWTQLSILSLSALLWLISFILLYNATLSEMTTNPELIKACFPGAYGPITSKIAESATWAYDRILMAFKNPVGLGLPLLGLCFFIAGIIKTWIDDNQKSLLLLLPFIITLLASFAQKYPFHERLLVFLVPSILLLITQGCSSLKSIPILGNWLYAVAALILITFPTQDAFYYLTHKRMEIRDRQILQTFMQNYRPGDAIYMSPSARPSFWYYVSQNKFIDILSPDEINSGQPEWNKAHLIYSINDDIKTREDGKRYVIYREEYNMYNKDGFFKDIVVMPNSQLYPLLENSPIAKTNHKRAWLFLSRTIWDEELQKFLEVSFQQSGIKLFEINVPEATLKLYQLEK